MHYIGSNQHIVIETVSLKHLCRFWSPQFSLPFFNFSSLFSSHFFSSKKKGLTKDGVQFGVSKLSKNVKKVEKMPKMGVSDFAPKLAILVHDRFLPKSRKKTLQIAPLGPHFSKKWSIPHFDFSAVLSLGVGGVQSGGHFFVLKFVDFWRGQKKVCSDFRR